MWRSSRQLVGRGRPEPDRVNDTSRIHWSQHLLTTQPKRPNSRAKCIADNPASILLMSFPVSTCDSCSYCLRKRRVPLCVVRLSESSMAGGVTEAPSCASRIGVQLETLWLQYMPPHGSALSLLDTLCCSEADGPTNLEQPTQNHAKSDTIASAILADPTSALQGTNRGSGPAMEESENVVGSLEQLLLYAEEHYLAGKLPLGDHLGKVLHGVEEYHQPWHHCRRSCRCSGVKGSARKGRLDLRFAPARCLEIVFGTIATPTSAHIVERVTVGSTSACRTILRSSLLVVFLVAPGPVFRAWVLSRVRCSQQFLTAHSERTTCPATRCIYQPAVFIPMIRSLSNSLNCEKCLLARLPGMFRLPKSSYNRRLIVTFMNLRICAGLYSTFFLILAPPRRILINQYPEQPPLAVITALILLGIESEIGWYVQVHMPLQLQHDATVHQL
ncbi:uncharacterized protein TNCV_343701 [Trichonephila clavipes]|nr:uncharacterized protein TNCV_343701 [Trichonephila clavipes]